MLKKLRICFGIEAIILGIFVVVRIITQNEFFEYFSAGALILLGITAVIWGVITLKFPRQ